ncbi:hypothetical protein [Sediminicurvatus halobius]|uniref:hypothetical protein n=1 Tax=Sediminicurvatus halobius TaxID=2182432 RepID=UPI0018EE4EFA|nr:hypothetical protein [Spiribacter halobius]UEX78621.1 hypothetical protein LMH63_02960 [Spiribacter halobius]
MSKKRRAEAHVRLYRHELECEAYRSLSTDARALLVEFRALYDGRENRVHMSIREAMRRLGVGRWRAEKALYELSDRGFIRLMEPGGFSRKVRHATVYALTNEPLEDRDGATAPKDFMRWHQKSTVLVASTDGVSDQHREHSEKPQKAPHGVGDQHRNGPKPETHGVGDQHTDRLPGGLPAAGGMKT